MGADPQPLQMDASDIWGNVMVDIEEYDLQALTAMRERRGLAPLPLEQRLNEVVLKRLESRTTPTQNISSILGSSSGDVQHHRTSSMTNYEDGPLLPVKQLFQPLPLQLPPISDELEGTATAPMQIATSTSTAPTTGGGGSGSHVPVPTISNTNTQTNAQTNANTQTNTNTRQSQAQRKRFSSSRGSSFLSRDKGRGSIQVYKGNL
jgi:hypothetical protein